MAEPKVVLKAVHWAEWKAEWTATHWAAHWAFLLAARKEQRRVESTVVNWAAMMADWSAVTKVLLSAAQRAGDSESMWVAPLEAEKVGWTEFLSVARRAANWAALTVGKLGGAMAVRLVV